MARRILPVLTALVLGVVAYIVMQPSEEERIRARMARAAGAAVEKDARAVMEDVAEDFRGPGGITRAQAELVVQRTFQLPFDEVEAQVHDLVVELDAEETRAITTFRPVLRGRRTQPPLEDDLVARWRLGRQWEMEWRLRDGDWRVVALVTRP